MERHASYAIVGMVSTALFIVGIVFVVWLGGTRFGSADDQYQVIFHGPVRGLSVGSEVQFNGIKFGQIERIRLDERDPNRVITDIILTHGTPVRADSIASTESQGISGVSIVQISAGTPSKPLLRDTTRQKRPIIRSKTDSLSALLQGGGQMIESATNALDRVNRLLSDKNIATVGAMMQDVRLTTHELAANRAMFAHAASTLAKFDRTADDIQHTVASVRDITDTDGRKAFADISAAASDLRGTIAEARGAVANINTQSSTFGATTLPAINETMQSLQETSDSLHALIRQIRQNPRRALTKNSGKELELAQ
jgi:phospholipid/cholesterol/gamma-HCH transport system substrate-binding protein